MSYYIIIFRRRWTENVVCLRKKSEYQKYFLGVKAADA
jgi:hypothetical protein